MKIMPLVILAALFSPVPIYMATHKPELPSVQKQVIENKPVINAPIQPPTPLPSPTPKILDIDSRNPDDMKKLDTFFDEYCKNNPCTSPSSTPSTTKKIQPANVVPDDEVGFCYVEKNGSFEMTTKDCMELSKSDPDYFRSKAYENCKEGKLPIPTNKCTEAFGLEY